MIFIKRSLTLFTILVLASAASAYSQTMDEMWDSSTTGKENPNLQWFKDAKFGMFIHWGVYAVPAGTYKGQRIDRIGEWIMNRGKIPVAEYKAFAREFNPVK